jgi:hypothetical protein
MVETDTGFARWLDKGVAGSAEAFSAEAQKILSSQIVISILTLCSGD